MAKAKKIKLINHKTRKVTAEVSPKTSKKAAGEAERRLRAAERKNR